MNPPSTGFMWDFSGPELRSSHHLQSLTHTTHHSLPVQPNPPSFVFSFTRAPFPHVLSSHQACTVRQFAWLHKSERADILHLNAPPPQSKLKLQKCQYLRCVSVFTRNSLMSSTKMSQRNCCGGHFRSFTRIPRGLPGSKKDPKLLLVFLDRV